MVNSEDIKSIFIDFKKGINTKSIENFKREVINSNTFKNRMKFGPSKIKLLNEYINTKKIIYVSDYFICCEDGIVLFEKSNGIYLSKGFYEFDKNIFIWFPFIKNYYKELGKLLDKVINKDKYIEIEKEKIKLQEKKEKELIHLKQSKNKITSELDKDGNGEVDVIEGNDFNTLLKKHQKSIVEIDRNYVQQFVKISSYLKIKKRNIQSIFDSIKDTPNKKVLNEYVEILKDEIHTYNLILFNSLNMIVSLVEDDMITFYEIYEMFDTINKFDSKHEKDVSQKLTNIGEGLESLMYEIRDMGNQISNSIDELSYVTEESNRQLTNQLSEIDSTMKVGNLINTINTYQNYKNNKNTKSLRG